MASFTESVDKNQHACPWPSMATAAETNNIWELMSQSHVQNRNGILPNDARCSELTMSLVNLQFT